MRKKDSQIRRATAGFAGNALWLTPFRCITKETAAEEDHRIAPVPAQLVDLATWTRNREPTLSILPNEIEAEDV
jgi:hypothetical protein